MIPRTGGRILADALLLHGADRVFCVPGESYLDVLDALYDLPIEVVVAKHEGAASNMAEADGKLTGRPGLCFVTRGPGATHASVGVHTARQDSTPMILFIGQVPRAVRGREAFQEVEFAQMFGPLAKWAAEIDDTARIPEFVARAYQVATSGRPGPVVLSLPEDVLSGSAAVADVVAEERGANALPAATAAAFEAELRRAQRPLVIVGGSLWTAESCELLRGFAERFELPVAASFRRQDLLDNDHASYVGHMSLGMSAKLAERVRQADLIIALGTRLSDVTTGGYELLCVPRPRQRLVHIHPEPGSVYQADVEVRATPQEFLAGVRDISVSEIPWQQWTAEARGEFVRFTSIETAAPPTGVDLRRVVAHLSERLPADSIITNGAGNYTVWVHRYFRYKPLHTELAPTSGCMGYGLPAAVAAKLRHPERTVVCFAGDGCFLMYPQELATAPIVVIVVNNGMYGTIRMHQERRFPGRVSGTQINNPDFVALARSFGAYGERVEATEAFAAAFERALAAGRSALLELVVDPAQLTPDKRIQAPFLP
ncbi:MAG: thiamine pyrophosphate-binding protein [Bryobacterales bacterium]|nr:thiamine pyrophosphate-binding protein [Bryobacterales bacterium]